MQLSLHLASGRQSGYVHAGDFPMVAKSKNLSCSFDGLAQVSRLKTSLLKLAIRGAAPEAL